MQMRIGPKHVTLDDKKMVIESKGAIQIYEDTDLGAHPVIGIGLRGQENKVVSSRLTSIFRVALFASKNLLNHDRQT